MLKTRTDPIRVELEKTESKILYLIANPTTSRPSDRQMERALIARQILQEREEAAAKSLGIND